ncbi:XK-related protein [Caenorhabditis elegans]|uniref:XK-related protein n=1 Tax=Caenorhabditis elegans TaxID=6239 RepID=Q95ZM0_CAEEL|nr:XK-related protein [Caenorhabditis elegans]CCD63738.1 XK-related protein [Caenorhabditis elegans]|eukprot:NP_494070.2 Uncharacterized protein CELE_F36H5.10 [Caenorhabditis elegans]
MLCNICCLGYLFADQFSEREVPIHYRLSKTTKITTAQKVFMVFFFATTEVFYIALSFIALDPLADEYVSSGFFYTTRFICPAINILAIPIVYVAFLAYNSEEFAFSGLEPTSGRFWHGVYKRIEKSGEWEYMETREPDSLPS